jgi:hypothetical protein
VGQEVFPPARPGPSVDSHDAHQMTWWCIPKYPSCASLAAKDNYVQEPRAPHAQAAPVAAALAPGHLVSISSTWEGGRGAT